MKILVIGSGAREHAILRSLEKEHSHNLYAWGGNPGIWEIADDISDGISVSDHKAISNKINELAIELVVVGPEDPLAEGIVDDLLELCPSIEIFGPTKAAAVLEASKSFAKDVMRAAKIPTSKSDTCSTIEEVKDALNKRESDNNPYVVKADGLAAGKGVVVTESIDEAIEHAENCFKTKDSKVVIEDYLDGPEFSQFFICDGKTALPLLPAQDFKRIFDGDKGANTGGMGSYVPLKWLPEGSSEWCRENIANPLLREMQSRNTPFVGVLFVGLAYTSKGIRVIEFNVRFGDPETQVVLEKMQSKLSDIFYRAAKGNRGCGQLQEGEKLKWDNNSYCNVVLASAGYPESSHKGDVITGLKQVIAKGGVILE
ncbi:MAG: phosphoribosylamine--glycine ligase, partial [Candidatus Ancillula sp.]|nr:phosphoribosylamine--glycine ligase [Candidatus Ancillula sp.]